MACSCSVVALRCNGGQLSDELAALELDDCPIRMVGLPDGKILLLALGGGGLVRVDVSDTEGGSLRLTLHAGAAAFAAREGRPSQKPNDRYVARRGWRCLCQLRSPCCPDGEAAQRMKAVGVVKCMAVSSDGRHLALGGEDGSLTVVGVPDMQTEASIRWVTPSVPLLVGCTLDLTCHTFVASSALIGRQPGSEITAATRHCRTRCAMWTSARRTRAEWWPPPAKTAAACCGSGAVGGGCPPCSCRPVRMLTI